METGTVRAAFAWSAVAVVVVSVVAFPLVDAHVQPNYRGLGSVGSTDVLELAADTDPALATYYGLPLAVRNLAPDATLIVGSDDGGDVWPRLRLASLASVGEVRVVDGSTKDWAAGAEIDGNVAASAPAWNTARGWDLVLDPEGDNDTLVLIEGNGRKDLVISAALLPAFPAEELAP